VGRGIIKELAIALLLGRNVRLVEVGKDGRAILRGDHPFECDCPICIEFDYGDGSARIETLAHVRRAINKALDEVERKFAEDRR
jgi:hypothetical protein